MDCEKVAVDMSKLRPECRNADSTSIYVPSDTALFLIQDAVARRGTLIHGRLDGPGQSHCAMGAFFADNPGRSISTALLDEVATVNDSMPKATARQRWLKVRSWLRWKLRVLSHATR